MKAFVVVITLVIFMYSNANAQVAQGDLEKIYSDWSNRRSMAESAKFEYVLTGTTTKHRRLLPDSGKANFDSDIALKREYKVLLDFKLRNFRIESSVEDYDDTTKAIYRRDTVSTFDGKTIKSKLLKDTSKPDHKGEYVEISGNLANKTFDDQWLPVFLDIGLVKCRDVSQYTYQDFLAYNIKDEVDLIRSTSRSTDGSYVRIAFFPEKLGENGSAEAAVHSLLGHNGFVSKVVHLFNSKPYYEYESSKGSNGVVIAKCKIYTRSSLASTTVWSVAKREFSEPIDLPLTPVKGGIAAKVVEPVQDNSTRQYPKMEFFEVDDSGELVQPENDKSWVKKYQIWLIVCTAVLISLSFLTLYIRFRKYRIISN